MQADAPRLLIVAHATPRPITDGPGARPWQLIQQLAQRANVRLLTVIDRPLNQQDWRTLHDTVPATTLVRRGRIGRYTRLGPALAQLDQPLGFHLALFTAPSLMSVRDCLPDCPLAVDFAGVSPRPGAFRVAVTPPDFALLDHPDADVPVARDLPADRRLAGEPDDVAADLIARLYDHAAPAPATQPAAQAAQPAPQRRAA